jgi:EmrB/QacA subfamily drug resistance transporter
MNTLDSTIVNVALVTLGREFHVPPVTTEAVVVAYLVSLAVFIPSSGWLGDRFGTKRVFLTALALFVGASALCGQARSLEQLVAFRVLQGAGGGLLTPVGMAMLYRTFPPQERVAVGRILMFATILGPASGPVLGGFLIERFSWRWAFYVNIPVGLIAFAIGFLFLREHRESAPGRFDLPGFVLGGAGLGLVMYALSEGPQRGWTSPDIAASAIAGILTLAVFVIVELRSAAPMVQLRLLAN